MSISKCFGRLALAAAALAWGAFASLAADVAPPPVVPAPVTLGAAPVSLGAPGCANCEAGETCPHGVARSKCHACGRGLGGGLLHRNKNAPAPGVLCPGSCFGYFQTQWRKWDEVCPYPYPGAGPGAAPGGVLNPPRLLDPKMPDPKMPEPRKVGATPPGGASYHSYHSGSSLPSIPVAPNKFGN